MESNKLEHPGYGNSPLTGGHYTGTGNVTVFDPVERPFHYNTGKIEVIDFIEDHNLGFHLGNVVKYICRAGIKKPEASEDSMEAKALQDLEKAYWYLGREINRRKDTCK